MSAFLHTYGRDPDAAELSIRAALRIAEAETELHRAREARRALRDTVARFVASGLPPGGAAAENAAHAHFLLVEEEQRGRAQFAIDAGQADSMPEYITRTGTRIDDAARRAGEVIAAYERILGYQRPTHSVAAMVRQADVYDALTTAIRDVRFTHPRDMQRQLRGVPQATRNDVADQLRATVAGELEPRAQELECIAIARYLLAARIARRASHDDLHVRRAFDQLAAWGETRVAECADATHARDASFAPLAPGEIARAPEGRLILPPVGSPPVTLEAGD
jgi:hypothetical protein